jgi:hypothetical protein
MTFSRLLPWVLRVAWAALPVTAGPSLEAALKSHSTPVAVVGAVGLWAVWGVVLVAILVQHPLGLTALRMAAPGAVAATVAAAFDGHGSVLAVAWSVAVMVIAFLPETGIFFVNGPAYPNERRFPLRPPLPLLFGPLLVVWALLVALPAVALLLLASRAWLAGGIAVVVAGGAGWFLWRPVHSLSRRWVVFVPAGVVLHDPLSLADPVLFERRVVETLRPAPAGTDSLDLTQRAAGLPVELILVEKVPMVLVKPGDRFGESGSSARLLFTPTRPGAVLAVAAARRLPVG